MLRPAELCRGLRAALEVSDGRRRRRKRDTTPDAIGLGLKRELLDAAIREDPDPMTFEEWLDRQCAEYEAAGPARAMARSILEEWRLAGASPGFRDWLERGAPSDDATTA